MNLYHYTNQNGFLGILENKELWATKIQFLNDHKEYCLAKNLAERALKALLRNPEYKGEYFRIERFLANLDNYLDNNLCVFSFSEKDDLLSQWRGYSNSHGGYSIGFKKSELEALINSPEFNLEKCIYAEFEQVTEISKIIFESLDKFKDYIEPEQDFVVGSSDSVAYFIKRLSYLSSYIKDCSFSEEQEWRIIALVPFEGFDFRSGKSSLIPFKKIKIEDNIHNIISEITVGHTPNLNLALQSTKCFLLKKYPVRVGRSLEHRFILKESKIPYRNW